MTRPERILVTGATGKTGSHVVSQLIERPGVTPILATRAGGPSRSVAASVQFDWHDPASTIRALEESQPSAVYLVAPPRDADPARVMQPFFAAAHERGVRRAVLLGAKPVAAGERGLGAVYDAVAASFAEWTVLRPTWFMQDFVADHYLAAMVREGALRTASMRGTIAYIDARDIAAVAVTALTATIPLNGELVLTGPAALTAEEVASIIGRELHRTVRTEHVAESELAQHLSKRMPPALAKALAHADATYSDNQPTDTVERITAQTPRSLAQFVRDERAAFKD
ncbi:NAD(P)H-binding protein [Curtobacterium sp. MCBD17_003]|uniref:NAD(P)H-binding protein n=1 Tax=Curtobacterium sp. MCBD17_003 TaxID=2175667 RepID=UPI000DA7E1A1|nr:NAD(P)H-binding protein [Curtobacterium sp. MCBD17_003]WIE54757.1 NAD(P)H-binding protein [Curtobacterium sp. MCBD17_003]